jgi:hypothetical protein
VLQHQKDRHKEEPGKTNLWGKYNRIMKTHKEYEWSSLKWYNWTSWQMKRRNSHHTINLPSLLLSDAVIDLFGDDAIVKFPGVYWDHSPK